MKKMEKKRKRNNIMNLEFPPDVLLQILLKLPFSNLLNCRLVCKSWKTCLSSFKLDSNLWIAQISGNFLQCVDLDPKHLKGMNIVGSFKFYPTWGPATKHLRRIDFDGPSNSYYTPYASIGIANSCHGLLCIFCATLDRAGILNPMTNEYAMLPRGDRYRSYIYGFGFSPKTKQYKIARNSLKNGEVLVEILAFGTSLEYQKGVKIQWRHIVRMSTTVKMHRHGTYFNGAIYWVGEKGDDGYDGSTDIVLWRLNIEDEKFEKLWFPKVGVIWKYTAYCGVFNGKLYLSHYMISDSEYHVWMMDGRGLWERRFCISIPKKFNKYSGFLESHHFQLIKLCEDGKILCLLQSFLIVLYDPKTGKFEKLDHRKVEFMEAFRIHHIDSIHFLSLYNILTTDAAAA